MFFHFEKVNNNERAHNANAARWSVFVCCAHCINAYWLYFVWLIASNFIYLRYISFVYWLVVMESVVDFHRSMRGRHTAAIMIPNRSHVCPWKLVNCIYLCGDTKLVYRQVVSACERCKRTKEKEKTKENHSQLSHTHTHEAKMLQGIQGDLADK